MSKFIAGWIALLIVSFSIYTPVFFLFMNSSDDEIEELTFEQIIPSLSMRGVTQDETERRIDGIRNFGVATDVSILESLEKIDGVSNIETTVTTIKSGKVEQGDMFDRDFNKVRITFSDSNNISYSISAVVIEKSFFNFSPALWTGFTNVESSQSGKYSREDQFNFYGHLFKNESAMLYSPVES
tara:strand:- start:130 stop:681 length:552 start_codon:yes stop_codon:yes gene_type:complete